MSLPSLTRRLDRIETRNRTGRITGLCNLAGYPDSIVAEAVRDWRIWTSDGRASRCGDTLILRAPALTAAEWVARYAPRTGSLQ